MILKSQVHLLNHDGIMSLAKKKKCHVFDHFFSSLQHDFAQKKQQHPSPGNLPNQNMIWQPQPAPPTRSDC